MPLTPSQITGTGLPRKVVSSAGMGVPSGGPATGPASLAGALPSVAGGAPPSVAGALPSDGEAVPPDPPPPGGRAAPPAPPVEDGPLPPVDGAGLPLLPLLEHAALATATANMEDRNRLATGYRIAPPGWDRYLKTFRARGYPHLHDGLVKRM